MTSIRLGAGLGFDGNNWEPVAAIIERDGVQFGASDHLAELTLASGQKTTSATLCRAGRATWCPCCGGCGR